MTVRKGSKATESEFQNRHAFSIQLIVARSHFHNLCQALHVKANYAPLGNASLGAIRTLEKLNQQAPQS